LLRRFSGSEYALPLTLSTLAFILYTFTLSPSINFGDSPELVSAAYNLGIAHPPGYPLYSLVGKLFAFIPAGGDIAGRVNLLSAFFAAASVFMAALITTRLAGDKSRLGAVFAALVLALSPTLWSQAVVAEVYTLNLFIFSLLVFLLLRWRDGGDRGFLYAGAFICGLGLGNHHTLLSLVPMVFIAPLFVKGRDFKSAKLYTLMLPLFILGLTVYIYLPLRSMQSPPLDWGDPETVGRFFDVVLRRQFPTIGGELTLAAALKHTDWYLKQLGSETAWPLLLAAIWGMMSLFRRDALSWALLAFLFIVNGIATLFFLNPSQEAYNDVLVMLIPSFAIMAIWVGLGVGEQLVELRGGVAQPEGHEGLADSIGEGAFAEAYDRWHNGCGVEAPNEGEQAEVTASQNMRFGFNQEHLQRRVAGRPHGSVRWGFRATTISERPPQGRRRSMRRQNQMVLS